jgi:hypothetical protein
MCGMQLRLYVSCENSFKLSLLSFLSTVFLEHSRVLLGESPVATMGQKHISIGLT